jgi:hypothetical protein
MNSFSVFMVVLFRKRVAPAVKALVLTLAMERAGDQRRREGLVHQLSHALRRGRVLTGDKLAVPAISIWVRT